VRPVAQRAGSRSTRARVSSFRARTEPHRASGAVTLNGEMIDLARPDPSRSRLGQRLSLRENRDNPDKLGKILDFWLQSNYVRLDRPLFGLEYGVKLEFSHNCKSRVSRASRFCHLNSIDSVEYTRYTFDHSGVSARSPYLTRRGRYVSRTRSLSARTIDLGL